MAFATSKGEATNRSTLAKQEYMWKLKLRGIIEKTTETLQAKIFYQIAKSYNNSRYSYKLSSVRMAWGEVVLEEMDSKAQRISNYVKSGTIRSYDELEEWVRDVENLPEPTTNKSYREPSKVVNGIDGMVEDVVKNTIKDKKRG